MPRLKATTDKNHLTIVRHLEQCNFKVYQMHQMGQGFPDLLVLGYHHGYNIPMWLGVEVKTETGKLTEAQVKWHAALPEGAPVIVATDSADVLRWYGAIE